jgi:hypothetical protein
MSNLVHHYYTNHHHQTAHERHVAVSVSTLAVASVAHQEENPISSPNAVSYCTNIFLAVTDNQQLQQSGSGFFANAQNTLITDSSFIVSLL